MYMPIIYCFMAFFNIVCMIGNGLAISISKHQVHCIVLQWQYLNLYYFQLRFLWHPSVYIAASADVWSMFHGRHFTSPFLSSVSKWIYDLFVFELHYYIYYSQYPQHYLWVLLVIAPVPNTKVLWNVLSVCLLFYYQLFSESLYYIYWIWQGIYITSKLVEPNCFGKVVHILAKRDQNTTY